MLAGYTTAAIRWSVPGLLRAACGDGGDLAARCWATLLVLATLRCGRLCCQRPSSSLFAFNHPYS